MAALDLAETAAPDTPASATGLVYLKTDKELYLKDANGVAKRLSNGKFNATGSNPGVTDDSDSGYIVGSDWINTTTDVVYKCVDSTVGAAVWKDVSTSGTGDVVGPSSATDNAIPKYNTTSGKLVQNTGVTITDANVVSAVAYIASGGYIQLKEIATPSATNDSGKLYTKTNNEFYFQDGANAEHKVMTFDNVVFSNPDTGSNSEIYGLNSNAGGTDGTAFGNAADAGTGVGNTAVGKGAATLNGPNITCVGNLARMTTGTFNDNVLIGTGANSQASDCVAVGKDAKTTAASCTSVGMASQCNGSNSTALGFATTVVSGSTKATILGEQTVATGSCFGSIAIGSQASVSVSAQMVIGSVARPITKFTIGEGESSGTPQSIEMFGTVSSGTDITNADMIFSPGQSTGTGTPGNFVVKGSVAGSTSSSLNALSDVFTVNGLSARINTGVLSLDETTTPTAITGVGQIYTKTDNKLYFQDGGGTEHELAVV